MKTSIEKIKYIPVNEFAVEKQFLPGFRTRILTLHKPPGLANTVDSSP